MTGSIFAFHRRQLPANGRHSRSLLGDHEKRGENNYRPTYHFIGFAQRAAQAREFNRYRCAHIRNQVSP